MSRYLDKGWGFQLKIWLMKSSVCICCILWSAASLQASEILLGAGATFPSPFYYTLIKEYEKLSDTRIDYQGVGSGAGINLLLDKKVDFGASDIYLSDQDLAKVKAPIVHIPTCVGAVAIIYNMPNLPLKLNATLVAQLFMGKITNWSDSRIHTLNGSSTANTPVTVVHRSDSSGTTFLLTDYLSKTSKEWAKTVGRGKKVDWPVGLGIERNAGVAEMVLKIPGSVGYVSLSYAEKQELAVAAIKNQSGRYITPTQESVSLAANVSIPEDCRVLITNTTSEMGYPISAFTYILVYRDQSYQQGTSKKANALIHFLSWVVSDGQQYAKPLFYAPLPTQAAKRANEVVRSISYQPFD